MGFIERNEYHSSVFTRVVIFTASPSASLWIRRLCVASPFRPERILTPISNETQRKLSDSVAGCCLPFTLRVSLPEPISSCKAQSTGGIKNDKLAEHLSFDHVFPGVQVGPSDSPFKALHSHNAILAAVSDTKG